MKICRHNKIKAKKRVLDLKLGRKDIDRNVGPQFSEYTTIVYVKAFAFIVQTSSCMHITNEQCTAVSPQDHFLLSRCYVLNV